MVTDAHLRAHLNAVDFPAGRDDILRQAHREDAPPEVLAALRALPPVDYRDMDEVLRSARGTAGPEPDAAQRAARNRDRRHQRVARDLRGS
jgi:hypothetical protein